MAGRPPQPGRSVYVRFDPATWQEMNAEIERLEQSGPYRVSKSAYIVEAVREKLGKKKSK